MFMFSSFRIPKFQSIYIYMGGSRRACSRVLQVYRNPTTIQAPNYYTSTQLLYKHPTATRLSTEYKTSTQLLDKHPTATRLSTEYKTSTELLYKHPTATRLPTEYKTSNRIQDFQQNYYTST